MNKNKLIKEIEKLLIYGRKRDLIDNWDEIPVRNALLALFELSRPYNGSIKKAELETNFRSPQQILDNMIDYALDKGLIKNDSITARDLFDTKIMGCLMPRQSELIDKFWRIAGEKDIEQATNYFYELAQYSNYIRTERLNANKKWTVDTEYGTLKITINLAKPEKDPGQIEKSLTEEKDQYPLCQLCLENVGYKGRPDYPARQNLRIIPVILQNEQWFFQYSPYVYFNEHCIVINREHRKMEINKNTFYKLFDFIDEFPHYFIGSNADLPLVGGSILEHEHFQGGNYTFPMEKAEIESELYYPDFPDLNLYILKWPLSVIRLKGKNKDKIVEAAQHIFSTWKNYDDHKRLIKSHSKSGGEFIQHNTVTPIARKKDKYYELDLVLRNNRKTEEYPNGIFHPHQELHHIKKENIGLIEVMGLAILPGRLKEEMDYIKDILIGDIAFKEIKNNNSLLKHKRWIEDLLSSYGRNNTSEEINKILKKEVGIKFKKVLEDAGVFRQSQEGRKGFYKFLNSTGIEVG